MGNRVVWDDRKGMFYETWYFTATHRETGEAFWLRGTLLKTARPDASRFGGLWLARFDPHDPARTFGARRFFPQEQVKFQKGQFNLSIGASKLSEGRFEAEFEADGHRLSWDLAYVPHPHPLWLVPAAVRRTHLQKADVCVPNVDIRLSGSVTVDQDRYDFKQEKAGQAHHWGYHYAREWLWGHCNDFDGLDGAWFEALSVKLFDAGRWSLPVTMISVKTPSGAYGTRSPLHLLRSAAGYSNTTWRFVSEDLDTRIEAEFQSAPDRFVRLPYESPHNEDYFCHNSCLCDLIVRVFKRKIGGWRLAEELISTRKAAAEFCTRQETDPVKYVFQNLLDPALIQ